MMSEKETKKVGRGQASCILWGFQFYSKKQPMRQIGFHLTLTAHKIFPPVNSAYV